MEILTEMIIAIVAVICGSVIVLTASYLDSLDDKTPYLIFSALCAIGALWTLMIVGRF
jgi:membrane protein YdbS with pleckstrin-like domain